MTTADAANEHLIPAGTSPFRNDNWYGRLLLEGQDFLLEDGFQSLDEAAGEIQRAGKKVLLNIGDSSTSGWDTRVTVENKERRERNQDLLSAFFRYPTYSDMLRQQLGEDFVVLNAGIPGHTTIQGRRRLDYLLSELEARKVRVDIVTIYFGNNDSQWEANVEDKQKLLASRFLPLFIERQRLKRQKADHERLHLRTNLRDFAGNYRAMIRSCRRHGAIPVLLQPETPLYWKPGMRFVEDNFAVDENCPGYDMAARALERARDKWAAVVEAEWSDDKRAALEEARELDFIVPRIKQGHRDTLQEIARAVDVPLINTSIPREQDDVRYFVDYCHPVGEANEWLAAEIAKTVAGLVSGTIGHNRVSGSLLLRVLDSPAVDFLSNFFNRGGRKSSADSDVNKDIYTLY